MKIIAEPDDARSCLVSLGMIRRILNDNLQAAEIRLRASQREVSDLRALMDFTAGLRSDFTAICGQADESA